MPRLTNPTVRARLLQALSLWEVTGYVLLHQNAHRGLAETFGGTHRQDEVLEALHAHIRDGGKVWEVEETSPDWEAGFRYEVVLDVCGRQNVFFKMRLNDRDPDNPVVTLVSIHPSTPR